MGNPTIISIVIAILVTIIQLACSLPEDALIDTGNDQLGKIQGTYGWTVEKGNKIGRKYYWFTGIPYADPSSYTKDNRFKPSKVWNGTLPGKRGGDIFYADMTLSHCPQMPVIDVSSSDNEGEPVTLPSSPLQQRFMKLLTSKPSKTTSIPFNMIKSYYSREGVEGRRAAAKTNDFENGPVWGQEECLTMTINTPKLPRNQSMELLPVILFIHGGGFDAFWGNIFGGQRLLQHDVIVVTINYRLGILGSLNLGIEDAPGNGAVYDCITALRWIQKYIHLFGGDKNQVTVSGQSAGAVLATTILVSPLAKGLFHRVIGASGSVLSVWANQKNPIKENLKIASFTSCSEHVPTDGKLPTDEEAQILRDCLKNLKLSELVYARNRYGAAEAKEGRLGYDAVVPSIQKASLAEKLDLALDDTPLNIVRQKKQSNVPLMMGTTRHDGSFVMVSTYYDFLVATGRDSNVTFIRDELLPVFLKGIGLEDASGALLHSFQETYLGESANSDEIYSKFPGLLDIHSVLGFKAGAYGLVEHQSKINQNSYYYAFDYRGLFTVYEIAFGITAVPGGVAHVDDLLYLFQMLPLLTNNDWEVSQRYVDYWYNFAKYGNPNGAGNLDTPFPKYNAIDHRFLVINGTDRIGYHCRDTWRGNSNELKWRIALPHYANQ